jgi:hypothetical protein
MSSNQISPFQAQWDHEFRKQPKDLVILQYEIVKTIALRKRMLRRAIALAKSCAARRAAKR